MVKIETYKIINLFNFKLKAQASLETALLVGLFLVLVIPTIGAIYVMSKNVNDEATIFQAKVVSRLLAQRMYEIDSQPSNASANFVLFFPAGTKSVILEDIASTTADRKRLTKITLTMYTSNGESNVSSISVASLPPTISIKQFILDGTGGVYQIIINKTIDDTYIGTKSKEGVDIVIIQ
ncbi:MAG: hypothetical protein QW076_04680 [Candidatus Anstonellales archaeon]